MNRCSYIGQAGRIEALVMTAFAAVSAGAAIAQTRHSIVTTTAMIGDSIRHVAGDRRQVESLMGEGVDPHLYRPTRSDVARLTRADLIYFNGLNLEPKMESALDRIAATGRTVVAAFDAVNSILVIAMFICPASTARLLTDRLSRQLWISALVAVLSGVAGYFLAAFGPFWLGATDSLNAAGMIAVVAGGLQMLAMLFAPRYGVLPRLLRRRRMRETA